MKIKRIFICILFLNSLHMLTQDIVERLKIFNGYPTHKIEFKALTNIVLNPSVQTWTLTFWLKIVAQPTIETKKTLLLLKDIHDHVYGKIWVDFSNGINFTLNYTEHDDLVNSLSSVSLNNNPNIDDFDIKHNTTSTGWNFITLAFSYDLISPNLSTFRWFVNMNYGGDKFLSNSASKDDLFLQFGNQEYEGLDFLVYKLKMHDFVLENIVELTPELIYGNAQLMAVYKFNLYPNYLKYLFNLVNSSVGPLIFKSSLMTETEFFFKPIAPGNKLEKQFSSSWFWFVSWKLAAACILSSCN